MYYSQILTSQSSQSLFFQMKYFFAAHPSGYLIKRHGIIGHPFGAFGDPEIQRSVWEIFHVKVASQDEVKLCKVSYPSFLTFVVCAKKNRLTETVLLSTHNNETVLLSTRNICFGREIRKIF